MCRYYLLSGHAYLTMDTELLQIFLLFKNSYFIRAFKLYLLMECIIVPVLLSVITERLWAAPELLRLPEMPLGGTQKSDVYSFGIIVHEIIYRESVFYVANVDLSPKGRLCALAT